MFAASSAGTSLRISIIVSRTTHEPNTSGDARQAERNRSIQSSFNDNISLSPQQVETVGDKYMAVSGLPDECENHAACIARLALDMIERADNVKMGNEPIVSRQLLVQLLSFNFVSLLRESPLAFTRARSSRA